MNINTDIELTSG